MTTKHLLSIDQLSESDILRLIELARVYQSQIEYKQPIQKILENEFLANLFFENSTRTRTSFQMAASRLGCKILNPNIDKSAIHKGESFEDTLLTYEAMGVRFMAIRHPVSQVLEKTVPNLLKHAHVINAGDGHHEHPSQTLLDLMTIREHFDSFYNLNIGILGDIKHSRVANSLLKGLIKVNVKNINLISPPSLAADSIPTLKDSSTNVNIEYNLQAGLSGLDAVFVLRLQKERMTTEIADQLLDYPNLYQLTEKNISNTNRAMKIMHAGPINRGIEISDALADSPNSLILDQVKNSVPMRMAILHSLQSF